MCVEWGASWKKSEYLSSDHGQSDSIKINFYLLFDSREREKKPSTEEILTKVSCERCWTELTQFKLNVESFSSIFDIIIIYNWIHNITRHKCNGSASDVDWFAQIFRFIQSIQFRYWMKLIFYVIWFSVDSAFVPEKVSLRSKS